MHMKFQMKAQKWHLFYFGQSNEPILVIKASIDLPFAIMQYYILWWDVREGVILKSVGNRVETIKICTHINKIHPESTPKAIAYCKNFDVEKDSTSSTLAVCRQYFQLYFINIDEIIDSKLQKNIFHIHTTIFLSIFWQYLNYIDEI